MTQELFRRELKSQEVTGTAVVMQSLDPNGKFASQSDVWEWRATEHGQDVPFGQCCDANGFKSTCACAARKDCVYQPPAANQMTAHGNPAV